MFQWSCCISVSAWEKTKEHLNCKIMFKNMLFLAKHWDFSPTFDASMLRNFYILLVACTYWCEKRTLGCLTLERGVRSIKHVNLLIVHDLYYTIWATFKEFVGFSVSREQVLSISWLLDDTHTLTQTGNAWLRSWPWMYSAIWVATLVCQKIRKNLFFIFENTLYTNY